MAFSKFVLSRQCNIKHPESGLIQYIITIDDSEPKSRMNSKLSHKNPTIDDNQNTAIAPSLFSNKAAKVQFSLTQSFFNERKSPIIILHHISVAPVGKVSSYQTLQQLDITTESVQ